MRWIANSFGRLPAYANTLIVLALMLYLTLMPHPLPEDTPSLFPGADKVVHGIMFWAFTTAWMFDAYRRNHTLSPTLRIIITATSIAFGGAIEVAQYLMAMGRGAEWVDLLGDIVGAIAAGLTSPYFVRWLLD